MKRVILTVVFTLAFAATMFFGTRWLLGQGAHLAIAPLFALTWVGITVLVIRVIWDFVGKITE